MKHTFVLGNFIVAPVYQQTSFTLFSLLCDRHLFCFNILASVTEAVCCAEVLPMLPMGKEAQMYSCSSLLSLYTGLSLFSWVFCCCSLTKHPCLFSFSFGCCSFVCFAVPCHLAVCLTPWALNAHTHTHVINLCWLRVVVVLASEADTSELLTDSFSAGDQHLMSASILSPLAPTCTIGCSTEETDSLPLTHTTNSIHSFFIL